MLYRAAILAETDERVTSLRRNNAALRAELAEVQARIDLRVLIGRVSGLTRTIRRTRCHTTGNSYNPFPGALIPNPC